MWGKEVTLHTTFDFFIFHNYCSSTVTKYNGAKLRMFYQIKNNQLKHNIFWARKQFQIPFLKDFFLYGFCSHSRTELFAWLCLLQNFSYQSKFLMWRPNLTRMFSWQRRERERYVYFAWQREDDDKLLRKKKKQNRFRPVQRLRLSN
jgi:hypothetical protein